MSKAKVEVEGKARVFHRETKTGKQYVEVVVNHIAKRKALSGTAEDDGKWMRFSAKFWDGIDASIVDGVHVRISGDNLKFDSWTDSAGEVRLGADVKYPTVEAIAFVPNRQSGFASVAKTPIDSYANESAPF